MKIGMKSRKIISTILFYLILVVLVICVLYPFVIMISGAFKTDMEMNRFPLRIIPESPTLEHFKTLFDTIPFWRQFGNSLMISTACALIAMTFNGLVAYGFNRFEFKGKNILFTLIISTMLIPGQVYMVPQFQMYQQMGFFGTYVPLLVPSTISAFGIFLITQIMKSVPKELYESATIDGCSEMRIFLQIAVPLSAAGLGMQGVLTFMSTWNDFMTPLIYLNEEIKYTLPIGLMRLQNFYKISYGAPLAGALLSCIPIIIILTAVGEKYFVNGMMAGAVKG
ncbi:MAG: carbohydrate ABC transporter permease [Massiliimalia sp.]|jgi:ABC-type glycerol-3-phosphate transport system permease component